MKRLKITTTLTEITEATTTVTMQLPYLVAIQAEIYDSLGEAVISETSITIQRNENQNWSEVV